VLESIDRLSALIVMAVDRASCTIGRCHSGTATKEILPGFNVMTTQSQKPDPCG